MKCRKSSSKAIVVFTLSIALFLTPFSTEAAGNITISVAVEPKLAVRPLVTSKPHMTRRKDLQFFRRIGCNKL